MSHTIEDMKSAYVFFNNARFGGSLPSPYGWGMSLRVGILENPDGDAECSINRDCITFDISIFGKDLRKDLYLLFHEMWHVYAGWEDSSSSYRVSLSSHRGAWAAGMAANDICVTSEVGHAEVIPGGSFDRLCDAWIEKWERGDAPSEQGRFPVAALGFVALLLIVLFLGISSMGGKDRYGGYDREYSYRGGNYDD